MKCTISGQNSRIFSKAIQSIARIGTDLFLEAEPDGMSVKTVNKTKSAFVLMLFQPDFFVNYQLTRRSAALEPPAHTDPDKPDNDENDEENEYDNKCKLSFKSCLHAFRNMRQVEECKIKLDSTSAKLKIRLRCRLETTKTHSLWTLEQEKLQSVYTTDNCPNTLTASHKLFDEIVCNFPANEEELTFEARPNDIVVRNYVDGSHVDRRYTRTQMTVQADEFKDFKIGEPTNITFSLREFRALLNFAHALKLDISVVFETAGKPVVFVVRNASHIETHLVMATLHPDNANDCTNNEPTIPPVSKANRKRPSVAEDDQNTIIPNCTSASADITCDDTEEADLISVVFAFPEKSAHSMIRRRRTSAAVANSTIKTPLVQNHRPSTMIAPSSLPSTVEATPLVLNTDTDEVSVEFCEESEEMLLANQMNELPASPQPMEITASNERRERRKRQKLMRHIFRPCFEPPSPPVPSKVLAYGSDDDEMRS